MEVGSIGRQVTRRPVHVRCGDCRLPHLTAASEPSRKYSSIGLRLPACWQADACTRRALNCHNMIDQSQPIKPGSDRQTVPAAWLATT